MRARIDIDHALVDRNLLGAALGDLAPWKVWRVVLKAAFALGLGTDEERAIFEEISGGRPLPAKRVRELWAVVARRGGKSRMAAAIGVYLALFMPRNLAPGEVGEVTIVAATREQATVVFRYVVGFLQASPVLRQEIEVVTQHEVRWIQQTSSAARVSPNEGLPMTLGEVRYIDPAAIEKECRDFGGVLKENPNVFVEGFMNAPSPGIVAAAIKNQYYDSDLKYLEALGEALRIEYETIVRSGFVLQIDAPDLALERHISYKDKPLSKFLEFVEQVVAVIDRALKGIPPDRVRLHVCWGNSESPHDSDVPLQDVLPIIRQVNVGALYLPFAGPRHAHEFRCFEKFPLKSGQILVAGVIDPLTNIIEHPEVVSDRIERIVAVIGDASAVLAANDCGFDTSAGWGRVAPDVVWAKLRTLRDGARLASARLF
jgi:5-methyltetrahydropteroyltriglutamate--homocysteine methyltransferase